MVKFSLVNFYLFSSMFVCSTFNDASLVVKGVLLIYLKWSPWQPGWKIFDYLCMVHHKPLKIHGQKLLPILYESYTHTPFFPGSPGLGNDFRNEILRFVNSAINCVQSGWIHFEQQRLQFKLTTPSPTTITSTSNALNFPVGGLLITLEHFTLKDNILPSFPKAESWYVWSPSAFKLKPYRLGKKPENRNSESRKR